MTLRRAMMLVAVCGFIAGAAGIGVRATYGAQLSVDEPQYLLTAISIAEDASLDISDEIADRRYLDFHKIPLDRQTEPRADGSEVSPHDPLLPLLLALPVKLGGWVGAKLFLALANGILGALLVWVAVRRFSITTRVSALVAGLFVASAPFAVYGNQIYPEVLAALAVTGAIAVLLGELHARAIGLLATLVVALPWLSIKYAPVAAVLALAGLVLLYRSGRSTSLIWLAGGLVVAGVVYLVAHVVWYGGWTVYSAGDHFVSTGEFSVVGTGIDLGGRSRRLIGLLVDERFGLALWQPAFLLMLPALGALARARPRGAWLLIAVAAVGWLNATFIALTMHGWWWPGRQTVVVLPALVLSISWWVDRRERRKVLVTAPGAVGVLSLVWLIVEGYLRRVTWVVDFFETTNPLYRLARLATPDYTNVDGTTWALHALWVAIAAVGIAWGSLSESRREKGAAAAPRTTAGSSARAVGG
jgi:hypothetical protein